MLGGFNMSTQEMLILFKSKKERMLKSLSEKRIALTKELGLYTQTWYGNKILQILNEDPNKILGLGEEKAKELKIKVNKLQNNAVAIVDEYLSDDSFWWEHKQDDKTYNDYQLPEKINNQFKYVLGKLGEVLSEYQLIRVTSESSTSGMWVYDKNKKIKYAYNALYTSVETENLDNAINEYVSTITDCQKINQEIKNIEKELKKENIVGWWNEL